MKTTKTSHPDEAALLRHAARDEARSDAAATRRHLASCARCRKRFETTRRLDAGLVAVGAAERRRAREAVPSSRADAYRDLVARLFEQARPAERAAQAILRAARSGPDELAAAMRALDGKPWRGFALLYAAKKGTPLVGVDPRRALTLAQAVQVEAASLIGVNRESRASTPAPCQAVQAEACLLEGQALLQTGEVAEARAVISRARTLFAEAGDLGFGAALCDFQEGDAANFGREYVEAEALIKRALQTFEEFGQDHLLAKSEAVLGTILANRGSHEAALPFLERSIANYDPRRDALPMATTLNNRANSLAQIGRFSVARATYAKAFRIASRNDFREVLRLITTGLAEIEFLQGHYSRALLAFRDVARDSVANGSPTDVLFARLYVAECLGRTGNVEAMVAEIESLREQRRGTPFSPSPAMSELFSCLDQGTIDSDLVAHVREYLQSAERGVKRTYRTLRRA